jgi:hypothetical protein
MSFEYIQIPPPHWYRPKKENTDIPNVDAEKADYVVTRGLNALVDNIDEYHDDRLKVKLPDWTKNYYPPKAKKIGERWQLTRSQLAESLIWLHGKPFRLNRINERGKEERRRYLFPIYNTMSDKVLMMTARQVEKTTTIGNLIVSSSICTPFYRSIYLTPSIIQTSTFSAEKLSPVLRNSPLINNYFIDASCRTQAFDKSFTNGSYIFLRSAFYTADRARGISSHLFCADEIQDQLQENLEVVSECLSHAAFPKWFFTGTPKSLDNTISGYWIKSTQTEWFVPCLRHGFADRPATWEWQMLGFKNIGKEGVICKKCGNRIDPMLGEWRHTGKRDAWWKGFRISQLMVPWIPWKPTPGAPDSILYKLENYEESSFYNEVLGLPHDLAEKPITQEDLRKCCDEAIDNEEANLERLMKNSVAIFAGIDWGTKTLKSYTVFTAGYFDGQYFRIVFAKRYEGPEADYSFCLKDIQRIINKYNVVAVGADQGIGFAQNDLISYSLHGYTTTPFTQRKLFPIMYVGNQHEYMVWKEDKGHYTLERTKSMNDLFQAIKAGKVRFPKWDSIYRPFFEDILNIHKEVRTSPSTGEKVLYSHHPDCPDDFCHALNFCRQIANRYYS